MPDRETKLKDAIHTLKAAIAAVAEEYDYIPIDCPPTLNLLTLNEPCAADSVLIPMQCEYYALEGLSDLVGTLRKMQQHLNPTLEIEGLLRTMYDPRMTLSQQVAAQLEQHISATSFCSRPSFRATCARRSAIARAAGAAARQGEQGRAGVHAARGGAGGEA